MSQANELELQLLGLINAEREIAALDPLRLIVPLNAASESHSRWMLDTDNFSHTGEDGSSPYARMTEAGYPFEGASTALENIGWQSARGEEGYSDDVVNVHESLMQSAGHRANILSPDVEDIGLGVEIGTFTGASGDYEAVMVTEVFAKTDADVSALVDTGSTSEDEIPLPPEDGPDSETPVPDVQNSEDEPDTPAEETPVEPTEPEATPEDDPEQMETPDSLDPEGDTPVELPKIALPCDLDAFTFDLSGAFEFRQEGDQWIWETSEEKLVEVFLAAFDEWTATPQGDTPDTVEVFVGDDADDIDDLLLEDTSDEWHCMPEPEDNVEDEWMSELCA